MKNKTNLIFLHKLITAFADSMVKAFVPLLILKQTNNMWLVMMYLNVYYVLCGLFNFIFKKFLEKYGIFAIILHIIPIIAMQFILSSVSMVWWSILIVALLASLAQVLYSVPLNLLFTFTDKDVNVAKFQIPTNVGKLIFILFSGYILGSDYESSVLVLSIIATILYLGSIVPIMYGYRLIKESFVKITSIKPNIDKHSYKLFNIFHICFGIFQTVLDVMVPLFLYINNLTFESVAIVMVLIELCKVGANLFAKFMLHHNKAFLSCCISIACFLIGCIIILVVKNAVVLYICSCLVAISFPLLFVPMFSIFCKIISKDNYQFNGMTYRDIFILPSKCIMLMPYFALPNLIGQFIIGMLASIGMGVCCKFILKEKNNE